MEKKWLNNTYATKSGSWSEWRNAKGELTHTVVTIESSDDGIKDPYDYIYAMSEWATSLTPGVYSLSDKVPLTPEQKYNMTLGWGLGSYVFDKYKTVKAKQNVILEIPKDVDKKRLLMELEATGMVQDLINEPPNILTTDALAEEAMALSRTFNAQAFIHKGEELKEGRENYPLVYAVGKGAQDKPYVVDIRWGDPKNPAVTLAGKGVIFDTGGINRKDDDEMGAMKNDMAGAAHAMALAYLIMKSELPVNLRLLLPIVDNSDGNNKEEQAYRQSDILHTRKGETLEVVHTDAEGRLILSDILFEATHPKDIRMAIPELVVDFATLSWFGHFELPGFGSVFSNKDRVQEEFLRAAARQQEYFAPRPLLRRLMGELKDCKVADLRQCNNSHLSYDDILAALLLHHHVGDKSDWLHVDLQPWRSDNDTRTKYPPHLPDGGFTQGVRTAFDMLQKRYGHPPPRP